MKLDVQVCGRAVAQLYRERDEYVLAYLPDTTRCWPDHDGESGD